MNTKWSLPTRYLALVILLMLLAAFVYSARALIGPLVIAALLAYVLQPAVTLVANRTHLRRPLAVSLVYTLALLALLAIPALFAPAIINQRQAIIAQTTTLQEWLQSGAGMAFLSPYFDTNELSGLLTALFSPQQVLGVLQSASANLAWVLVILVTTYYFLLDWERLLAWVLKLVPPGYNQDALRLLAQVQIVWQSYLRGQLLLMFLIGLMTFISTAVVGLPEALLLGILAGALDVVPSVGPAVAMIIAAVVAFSQGSNFLPLSNPLFALLVVAIFIAIQTFENVWLRPRIYGQRLQLHPAIVFIAIVGSLALAGVLVALIIVPLISSAEIVGRYAYRRILGLNPWDEPHMPAAALSDEQKVPARPTLES